MLFFETQWLLLFWRPETSFLVLVENSTECSSALEKIQELSSLDCLVFNVGMNNKETIYISSTDLLSSTSLYGFPGSKICSKVDVSNKVH
jgi:hypothetical protein